MSLELGSAPSTSFLWLCHSMLSKSKEEKDQGLRIHSKLCSLYGTPDEASAAKFLFAIVCRGRILLRLNMVLGLANDGYGSEDVSTF